MRTLLLLCLVIAATACTQGVDQAEFAALQNESRKSAEAIQSILERIDSLERQIRSFESSKGEQGSPAVIYSPTEPGFTLGSTKFGKFAVSVEDITPYGAGSRVRLQIMNLTSATLAQATLKVEVSKHSLDEMIEAAIATPPVVLEGESTRVEHGSMLIFPPGAWVNETVTLPDVKPDQLKIIYLRFEPAVLRGPTR